MPDEIELLEKPVSPLGRLTIRLLGIFLSSLLIYACIGQLDIVATARGRVKPKGDVQLVQMPKTGVINQLFVEEGQFVKQDEDLFSVNDNTLAVDIRSYEELLERATLEKKALTALLENKQLDQYVTAKELQKYPEIKTYYKSVSENQVTTQDMLGNQKEQLAANLEILQAEKKTIESTLQEKTTQLSLLQEKQQLKSLQAEIDGIKQQISHLTEEEEAYRVSVEEGKLSESFWKSKKNERVQVENELAIKEGQLHERQLELTSQHASLTAEIANVTEQLTAKNKNIEIAVKQLEELDLKIKSTTTTENQDFSTLLLEKEKQIKEYEALTEKGQGLIKDEKVQAPIAGTVTEMTAEEIGLTLQQSQKVMAIVPKEAELYVEAYVKNQDIGFVKLGQQVSLKVDSFNFQKYGLLEGEITFISPTAVPKEKMGNVYKIQVKLHKKQTKFREKQAIITPGMEVTAEIQTGKRRIISFFLEPLIKYLDESLKLR